MDVKEGEQIGCTEGSAAGKAAVAERNQIRPPWFSVAAPSSSVYLSVFALWEGADGPEPPRFLTLQLWASSHQSRGVFHSDLSCPGGASALTWKGLEITETNVSVHMGETKVGDL